MEKVSRDLDPFSERRSQGSLGDPRRFMLVLVVAAWVAAILAVLMLR